MPRAQTESPLRGQRVLITGCSSGIGRALARTLSVAGMEVFASARERAALVGLEGLDERHRIELDVTDAQAVDRVVRSLGGLDALINNAGYGCSGAVEEVEDDELREQYEVNLFGPWRLCRSVLPAMRRRGRGTVVNISSYGAQVPYPFLGAYRSSKAALEAMSAALHLEVRGFGIRVMVVQPGRVDTAFARNVSGPQRRESAYDKVRHIADKAYDRMSPPPGLAASAVAHVVREELERGSGPLKVVVGGDARRNLRAIAAGQRSFERYLNQELGLS